MGKSELEIGDFVVAVNVRDKHVKCGRVGEVNGSDASGRQWQGEHDNDFAFVDEPTTVWPQAWIVNPEGCVRCACGCKYWEANLTCVDCGTRVDQYADQLFELAGTV